MIKYNDIFNYDKNLMYYIYSKYGDTIKSWKLFFENYKDPDGYPIDENGLKARGMIKCSADALISVKRIYSHEGFNQNFINTFSISRKTPIIFFPAEKGGINTSRYTIFGDRIDHTLFDIKRYFEGYDNCRLIKSYNQEKTKEWLKSFDNFIELIKWLRIEDVFVDVNYNVYDLESGNKEIIQDYSIVYKKVWSKSYYNNLKEKIIEFNNKNQNL